MNKGYNPSPTFTERREKPRVACSYPAIVRGRQPDGSRFEARAVLANMSASGMYLRMDKEVIPGEPLFVLVRLAVNPPEQPTTPQMAASGTVVRAESQPEGALGGAYGVAIKLLHNRFLYSAQQF
jgi:hypothetical protein